MKKLLLSTAFMAGIGDTVMAQDATASGMFRPGADAQTVRASEIIGMRVYTSEAVIDADEFDGVQTGWDDIGEINDVILSRDGAVDSVLIDIGGFLGMGEREVAVGMEALRFVSDGSTGDAPNDFFLVISAARADLEAAPDYMSQEATDGVLAADADANAATEVMREPIVRDGYMTADVDYLTSDKLTGVAVYDANDEEIGNVSTLVLTADGQVDQAIIDVGGWLGMGEKPVALSLTDIDILRNEAGDDVRVYLTMTKEELEAMPAFEG